MTTWTTIPDTNLDPGAPVRSIDGKALRDNPIAISEGSSGAPKVRTAALQPPAAGTAYLIRRVQDAWVDLTGTIVSVPLGLHDRYSAAEWLGFTVLVPGTVTAYAEHYGDGVNTSTLSVYKNGTLVTSWNNVSGAYVTRTVDISVSTGDIITWEHTGAGAPIWRGLRVYSNNPDMAVA